MGATGSRKKVPNYLNTSSKLNVQGQHAFRKNGYMNGIKVIRVHSGTILEEFPTKEMVESKTLDSIYLNEARVVTFHPGRMRKLKLKELQIITRGSSYENILSSLSDVSTLEELHITNKGTNPVLDDDKLKRLLKKISGAKNLKRLSLENMNIQKFPNEFFEMSKLNRLELRNNNIIEPSVLNDIYKLKNLEDLDLSYNEKLKGLPNTISKLKLERLLLFGNPVLKSLPKNIGNMNSLVNIGVSHRTRINIPESILKLPNRTTVQYYALNRNRNRNEYLSVSNYYKKWRLLPSPKITKNTQFINKSITSVPMKNIPKRRYITTSVSDDGKIHYVYSKEAIKSLEKHARNRARKSYSPRVNYVCPFTRAKYDTRKNVKKLPKSIILQCFVERMKKTHNYNRDLQNFKNSRPKDITLNDINNALKKINISSPSKK
jgi:hypothetical protein